MLPPSSVKSVGTAEASQPALYPDYILRSFPAMAGALRDKWGIIARLLIDLDLNPSPDLPISVEVRCDCLEVIPREQVLSLSITTGFCVLPMASPYHSAAQSISFWITVRLSYGLISPLLQAWKNDSAWWPLNR